MIRMFKQGVQGILNHKVEIMILYLVHLISSLLPGAKLKSIMASALGNSTAGDTLLYGFNSDTFTDLIRHQEMDLKSLLFVLLPSLLLGLLLYIYISGGVISSITNNNNGVRAILRNGWAHINGYLITSLIGLGVLALLCGILWIPFIKYSGDPIQTYNSEKPFIQIVIALFILSLFVVFCVSSWSVRAKSLISIEHKNPYRTALQWLLKNIFSILFFCFISVLLLLVTGWFFSYILSFDLIYSSIWASIIIGQILVFALCKIKVFYWSGLISQD